MEKNRIKENKILPIGTVCLLDGGKKRLMITGYFPVKNEDGKKEKYDYMGCLYPEGILSFENVILFNHNQIKNIYHLGLINDKEEQVYIEELSKINEEK